MDRSEFSRRFAQRQSKFLQAVSGLISDSNVHWSNYVCEAIIDNSGCVSVELTKDTSQSNIPDKESLLDYLKFLTGQGYCVDVATEWRENGLNFHVVGWEEEEPLWPEELNLAFTISWHPVSGPESLGM
ncbi:hypothetical protein KCM76_24915 [Zooshikella marina]|uniref:hypothetical protein n=1 Tax=Zooshikella ganghwensis TaxID=202772 RepID=UPI001BAF9F49|nr:hypothetical protein [Zooshikella ganghwensis]MBU2709261.1 hypothetical protein [Zooshikella ganghwensis]